ncbi:protein kinase domain-containing protein [Lederbergia citrea]|uniref:protein kinase domain-containing protein n=1 Tax=Lederbergia citrea TaxID=2833581 RepID=UPI001BC9CBC6|nr:serine/threonine-protein kinase [Lederbergia citrea]MBS4206434.1 protein kinase family protein [Lederbergia citrea]
MMNNFLKSQCKYPSGTIVKGKWHKHRYQLVNELGAGANGVVYLAKGINGYTALKMSTDSLSITSEVNVLKAFAKVQGSALGPSLYDVDDWEGNSGMVHFYAMEYIQGPDLLSFVREKGYSWAGVMIVQLLDVLEELHAQGWIFGDLKPENLIVSGPTPAIRCIDVGGTTMNGRAIKEFTEFFDRGYWSLGSRKAEPTYDLFSTAMLMINLFYPQRFTKKDAGISPLKQLMEKVRLNKELNKFEPVMYKALLGEYKFAREMKKDMLVILAEGGRYKKLNHKQKKNHTFLESASIVLITGILYALYLYGHIF